MEIHSNSPKLYYGFNTVVSKRTIVCLQITNQNL